MPEDSVEWNESFFLTVLPAFYLTIVYSLTHLLSTPQDLIKPMSPSSVLLNENNS